MGSSDDTDEQGAVVSIEFGGGLTKVAQSGLLNAVAPRAEVDAV